MIMHVAAVPNEIVTLRIAIDVTAVTHICYGFEVLAISGADVASVRLQPPRVCKHVGIPHTKATPPLNVAMEKFRAVVA